MRVTLLKIVTLLVLAGSGDGRPQKAEELPAPRVETSSEGWKASQPSNTSRDVREDSRTNGDGNRHLKDLQYMDQSLRTVATQLLNVTSPDEKNVIPKVSPGHKTSEKSDASLIKEVNSEISNLESMGIGFGRPMNSKFAYFESSHPGQAMAITEEELEKEMSSTRLMTAYKNHPTTTGGISTWILLNPPSTTVKSPSDGERRTKHPVETEVRITTKPVNTMERIETTEKAVEKLTPIVSSTVFVEKLPATTKKPVSLSTRRTTTTPKPEKLETVQSSTTRTLQTSTQSNSGTKDTVLPTGTTKKVQVVRTTPRPKVNATKTTPSSKPSTKPTRLNQSTRPKSSTKRTTVKPELARNENVSTAKIEKVTFRPIQMITTSKNRTESTEKPMFVTKIKASVLMDAQKAVAPAASSSTTNAPVTTTKSVSTDLVEVPVRSKPTGTKVNNVLKVQLKKPVDESTTIEVEPIKVNAPVLKIEKVEKNGEKVAAEIADKETEVLDNSRIDLKFDFNPELTRINIDTSTESSTTTMSTTTSTTKRPRHNSKRKKNKARRRKPSTVTAFTTTVPTTTALETKETALLTESIDLENLDSGIQESKVAPETKIATNSTKTKKKPPQKAISTQIYNFLSREVMPSFGMMSLVGLGLGLASYFLYPFGGTISRRNYEVEPKYKYNLDEYGGNYGQSEEEVLSKVLQGMTTNDNKYPGVKDYDHNYYRYQQYEGSYDSHTTKKTDRYSPISSSPIYRPENTAPVFKYRNTEYRYPEIQSTPNYYERQKHSEYAVGQDHSNAGNRQFVVGNVPKDYLYDEKLAVPSTTEKNGIKYEPTETEPTQFEKDMTQGFTFSGNRMNVPGYGNPESHTLRTEDGYEEVEITPTAVAVEHGPRALRSKRSSIPDRTRELLSRFRRDSVIQMIPTKKELEKEQEEENLSNEILDIIDSALPEEDYSKTKKRKEDNEVEDFEAQKKKKLEEERTRQKESAAKSSTAEVPTSSESNESSSTESTSLGTKDVFDSQNETFDSSVYSQDSEVNSEEASSSTTDGSTVEWIEITTKKSEDPQENRFNLFSFVKKVAEIKFRLGLTLLKHASEGFARYLGHVQKRINGEE